MKKKNLRDSLERLQEKIDKLISLSDDSAILDLCWDEFFNDPHKDYKTIKKRFPNAQHYINTLFREAVLAGDITAKITEQKVLGGGDPDAWDLEDLETLEVTKHNGHTYEDGSIVSITTEEKNGRCFEAEFEAQEDE